MQPASNFVQEISVDMVAIMDMMDYEKEVIYTGMQMDRGQNV